MFLYIYIYSLVCVQSNDSTLTDPVKPHTELEMLSHLRQHRLQVAPGDSKQHLVPAELDCWHGQNEPRGRNHLAFSIQSETVEIFIYLFICLFIYFSVLLATFDTCGISFCNMVLVLAVLMFVYCGTLMLAT